MTVSATHFPQVPALYFDGKTSRPHRVTLTVQAGIAQVAGDVERSCPIDELRVSERAQHTRRKVTFPDDAYLEVQDEEAFGALLAETGYRDSTVVRMQQSWRGALIAFVVTVAFLVLAYLYGLPLAAEAVAKALPEKVERSIGSGMLDFLDHKILQPSKLPLARQTAIVERFKQLTTPRPDAPDYTIVFRKSQIGPNAFALPSGQIIMTDELVALMDNDEQILGILAHELGHLHERHLMRRIVQSSAIGAAATLIFGDASAIVANIPTLMLDMKYSRDAEREADDYAIAMMKANDIPLTQLVASFDKLKAAAGNGDELSAYLSSHPPTSERMARIEQAR